MPQDALFRFRRVAFWTLTLLLAGQILLTFIRTPGMTGLGACMYGDMIYGRAHKPFVYRVLMPGTVRLISAAIPQAVQESFNHRVWTNHNFQLVMAQFRRPWEERLLTQYFLGVGLMYLALLGFLLALRALIRSLYRAPRGYLDLMTLLALLCLPPFFKYYSYIYDFSALFLFTLGLVLIVRARWGLFLLVYLIGCLNKETTILLSLVFCLHVYGHMPLRPAFKLLAAQGVIYLAVKAGLQLAFHANQGGFVEFWLLRHNIFLGPYALADLMAWLALGGLVFAHWESKPRFLRRALWIAVPLFVLTAFLGLLDELRDYYEAFPIVLLLAAQSVAAWLGVAVRPHEAAPGDAMVTARFTQAAQAN